LSHVPAVGVPGGIPPASPPLDDAPPSAPPDPDDDAPLLPPDDEDDVPLEDPLPEPELDADPDALPDDAPVPLLPLPEEAAPPLLPLDDDPPGNVSDELPHETKHATLAPKASAAARTTEMRMRAPGDAEGDARREP
jgi:hypothetical protein